MTIELFMKRLLLMLMILPLPLFASSDYWETCYKAAFDADVYRIKVPQGWIVHIVNERSSSFYVPDNDHRWVCK